VQRGGIGMNESRPGPRKGRGALTNRDSRFEGQQHEAVDDGWGSEPALPSLPTIIATDKSRTIITRNDSPDVPFAQSINPYRGCEHGCVYCFARPTHTYLGLSAGLDFETRLFVKPDAVIQLRTELSAASYACQTLALGTNTDPYQPIERRCRVMRGILELMVETRHPVAITTKAALVERDLDLLSDLARDGLVSVTVSVTTLDHRLARTMEPRAAAPRRRLQIIARLADAGVPVSVNVAPIIPALTDPELEKILESAAAAGARHAAYILLRLPHEVRDLFTEWLATHFPGKAGHVMSIMYQSRGGKAYDSTFGLRRRGTGPFADVIADRFALACRRCGLNREPAPDLVTTIFRPPAGAQQQLDF